MIIVVGSLNMDLVIQTERIPQAGETLLGHDLRQVEGGKGGNQAVAAGRLGGDVAMIGAVGQDDFGKQLLRTLEQNKINIVHVKESAEPSGVALIQVDSEGNNSITVASGANHDITLQDLHRASTVFDKADIILAQLEIPLDVVAEALRMGKERNCLTILNPAPAQKLPPDLLANTDILTPNEHELALLSGMSTETLDECVTAGHKLLSLGVRELIVTLGMNGSLHMHDREARRYPSYLVKMTDSTAAGDCFNGALATALDRGEVMEESIQYAMKAAAISVTRAGAQPSLPTKEDMENFDTWYALRRLN